MIYKNVASQKLAVFAYTASTGAAKTGDAAQITAYLSKDFGAAAATNDANPTELDATNMPGWYVFDLTQAETNAEVLILAAKSSTSGVVLDQVQLLTQDAAISSRLAPTTAGRTLNVSAGGVADADMTAISTDATAADNFETMLDGTGGAQLTLKKLYINNPDGSPAKAVEIIGNTAVRISATKHGLYITGGSNQALYLASSTAASTVYVEGPSDGTGSAIAISSPGSGSGNAESGEAVWIESQEGHPAIRVHFSSITNGNVMDVDDSSTGSWIWDDRVGELNDGAITAAKFDQSTAFPLAQADTGSTAVARTGADGDTLETLSDAIDGVGGGGLTAQETRDAMKLAPTAGSPAAGSVDDLLNDMPATILTTAVAAYDDTPGTFGYLLSLLAGLDFTAITLVATSNAGEITIKRTLTLAAVVSGLTIPADWTACYWTVKRSTDDADADALVQILVSNPADPDDGVLVLAGVAVEDQTAGSLTVNQALGTVTIALDDASTAALEDAVELVWDVKVHAPGGKTQPGAGTATITTAVTRT